MSGEKTVAPAFGPNVARADLVERANLPGAFGYVLAVGWVADEEQEQNAELMRELEENEAHGHSHSHGHGHDHSEDSEDDEDAVIRALLAPLGPTQIRVEWLDGKVSVHESDELRVLSRALLPADTVVSLDQPTRAGAAVEFKIVGDVKMLDSDKVIKELPLNLVSRVQDPSPGKVIAFRPASHPNSLVIGVVENVIRQLTVKFRDGSVCEVDDAGEEGPFPAEEYDGQEQHMWGEADYYPGMRVLAPGGFWQHQRFIKGQYRAPAAARRGRGGRGRGGRGGRGGASEAPVEGSVEAIRVTHVNVDYLYTHGISDEEAESVLLEELPVENLIILDHYSHLASLVGDRVSLAPEVINATPESLATLTLTAAQRLAHARSVESCAEIIAVRAQVRVRWQDGTLSEWLDTPKLREPLRAELAAQSWLCGTYCARADTDEETTYTVAKVDSKAAKVTLFPLDSTEPVVIDSTNVLHLTRDQPRVADRVIVREDQVGYVGDVDEFGRPQVILIDMKTGLLGQPETVLPTDLHLLKPMEDDEDDEESFEDEDGRFQFGGGDLGDDEDDDEDDDEEELEGDELTEAMDASKKIDFSWLKGAQEDTQDDGGDDDDDDDEEELTPEERSEILEALGESYHSPVVPAEPRIKTESVIAISAVPADHHFATETATRTSGGAAALNALVGSLPAHCTLFFCESNLDLLRIVIELPSPSLLYATPIVLDAFLPAEYPQVAPRLFAHTRGVRLHPALHASGRVCLTALGEWRALGASRWGEGAQQLAQVLTELVDVLSTPHGVLFSEPTCTGELANVLRDHDVLEAAMRYDERTILAGATLALAFAGDAASDAPELAAVRAHWRAVSAPLLALSEYAAQLLPFRRFEAPEAPQAPMEALAAFHVPVNPSEAFLVDMAALADKIKERM